MKLSKLIVTATAALSLGACVQTNMQGYADLQGPSSAIRHLAAFVQAPPNDAARVLPAIRSEAGRHGVTAEDVQTILPPTRQYSADQVKTALASAQIDALLVVSMGDSGIQNQYLGTFVSGNSTSTVSATGNSFSSGGYTNYGLNGTVNTTGYATATPMYRPTRQTAFQAKLIEAKTGRVLWTGQGETDSGGALFVGANESKSIGAIFDDLTVKHIIAPPAA